jgi:hypothetical protein
LRLPRSQFAKMLIIKSSIEVTRIPIKDEFANELALFSMIVPSSFYESAEGLAETTFICDG